MMEIEIKMEMKICPAETEEEREEKFFTWKETKILCYLNIKDKKLFYLKE